MRVVGWKPSLDRVWYAVMTKISKILLLLLTFVTMLGLSACGSNGTSDPDEQVITPYILTDNETNEYVKEVHKKLSDGRTVTCLLFTGYKAGGLDCDFANAK